MLSWPTWWAGQWLSEWALDGADRVEHWQHVCLKEELPLCPKWDNKGMCSASPLCTQDIINWAHTSSRACFSASVICGVRDLHPLDLSDIRERSEQREMSKMWLSSDLSEAGGLTGSQWVLWQSKVRHILKNEVVYIRRGVQRTWHHQDRWPSFFLAFPLISLIEQAQAVSDVEEAFIYIPDKDQ